MEFVAVKREIKKLGKDNDGRQLTMLGQIYGYTDVPGGIAVLQVEGEKGLAFLEVNKNTRACKELAEDDQELLLELWQSAEAAALLSKGQAGPLN